MLYIGLSGVAVLLWIAMIVFGASWARRLRHLPLGRRDPRVRRLGYLALGCALAGALAELAAAFLR